MSWGLAALSGLLGGLPGLPKGMNEGMQFDQRQQQIDESRRHHQAAEQASMTDVDQLYSVLGIPKPPTAGSGRISNSTANVLTQRLLMDQERQRKRAEQGQMSQALLEAGTSTGMAPGASVEMPQPGALMAPLAATAMPTMTQKTVDPGMAKLAKLVPMLSPEIAGSLIKETVIPPKPQMIPANSPGYLRGDKVTTFPTTPEAAPPPGMELKSVTKGGQRWETPGAAKSNLSQGVEDILQSQGINPLTATGPQIAAAREKVVQDQIRVQSAGAQARENVTKAPDAGERKDIANLNALVSLGGGLVNQLKANPSIKPGAAARLGERELGLGMRASDVIGSTQTPEQRRFMADATDLVATYRSIRNGLAVTNSEALRTIPLVPDDPGAVTMEQLQALVSWAQRNRVEIDRALVAANRRPGPPPQAPLTPPPAEAEAGPTPSSGGRVKWGRDANGKPVRVQ